MGVRYPPLQRGISAILARYPRKTRQMGAIAPSAILSRKGIARYGGVSRTGPLSWALWAPSRTKSVYELVAVRGLGEAWMTEYLEGLEAQFFDGTDSVAPSKVSPDASKARSSSSYRGLKFKGTKTKRGRREGDGKKNVTTISRHRQVTDLDVTVLGFSGPGLPFPRQVLCGDAPRLFFDHFSVHLSSVLGRTELCHEVWNPGPQKPQIISNENHHLALLEICDKRHDNFSTFYDNLRHFMTISVSFFH